MSSLVYLRFVLVSEFVTVQFIDEIVQVADYLGISVGEIIDGWARSHTHNLFDQFVFGIRYVDVRIVFDPTKGYWRTHHGELISRDFSLIELGPVLGAKTEVLLQQTQQFIQKYPKEVIVLELSHEFETNNTTRAVCMEGSLYLTYSGYGSSRREVFGKLFVALR